VAAVNALAGGASGFADSRPCPVLAGTCHELAATTRHPGCYHGASRPSTVTHATGHLQHGSPGCKADFSATMPAPRKR